jgi:hypothetical protein
MLTAAAQKRREVISNLTISLPAARSLCAVQRCEARAQRRAHCLQRERLMDNQKTSRREFCAHAISLVTVASLIEGCGSKGNPAGPGGGGNVPQLTTINGSAAGGTVTVSNISGTALANVGSAARVQAGGNEILVLQTAQGSQFNTSGGVAQGPATRALREFPTQFTNNVLTITV